MPIITSCPNPMDSSISLPVDETVDPESAKKPYKPVDFTKRAKDS